VDDEDSVSLEDASSAGSVAILRLPHVSNFDEFDRVAGAAWISRPVRTLYDTVILPGTKNTVADLEWMRSVALDAWVQRQHAAGAEIIGICGGFQMLGRSVDGARGLYLLPVDTETLPDKIVRPVRATINDVEFHAYEIHMGRTKVAAGAIPFATVDGRPEGIREGRVCGTYLHDALRCDAVLRALGLEGKQREEPPYDKLAKWFESSANVRMFEELYL
jgi:adenosylcobyric acid synthase